MCIVHLEAEIELAAKSVMFKMSPCERFLINNDIESCGASPTFSAVLTHISRSGAVTVGFSICQRADPAILTGVLRAKTHHLQAYFLTIDERGQLTPITEVGDNSLEWR